MKLLSFDENNNQLVTYFYQACKIINNYSQKKVFGKSLLFFTPKTF